MRDGIRQADDRVARLGPPGREPSRALLVAMAVLVVFGAGLLVGTVVSNRQRGGDASPASSTSTTGSPGPAAGRCPTAELAPLGGVPANPTEPADRPIAWIADGTLVIGSVNSEAERALSLDQPRSQQVEAAAWSPSAALMALEIRSDLSPSGGTCSDLFAASPDGSAVRLTANGDDLVARSLAWSGDGATIGYVASRGLGARLQVHAVTVSVDRDDVIVDLPCAPDRLVGTGPSASRFVLGCEGDVWVIARGTGSAEPWSGGPAPAPLPLGWTATGQLVLSTGDAVDIMASPGEHQLIPLPTRGKVASLLGLRAAQLDPTGGVSATLTLAPDGTFIVAAMQVRACQDADCTIPGLEQTAVFVVDTRSGGVTLRAALPDTFVVSVVVAPDGAILYSAFGRQASDVGTFLLDPGGGAPRWISARSDPLVPWGASLP